MRISTSQIFNSGVSAMQRAQSELNHTSLQMATGRRILTPSDDPSGAAQSVKLQAAINATEQYQRNADLAKPRLALEEAQLDSYENDMQRASQLIIAARNDTNNPSNRAIIATEIRALRDGILSLANTKDANGEYLFSGTKSFESFEQPFTQDGSGTVSYAGADGEGAVRKVGITATRSIQVGDTGQSVFMDIPEKTGRVLEGVMSAGNTGSLIVEQTGISDLETFEQRSTEVFTIRFTVSGSNREYAVTDANGDPVRDKDNVPIAGPYFENVPISFAGRSITLSGDPENEDSVVSRPAPHVSIFDTLDAIATALETPVTDAATREAFSDAASTALLNIDSSLGRMNEVRTSVGLRLNTLETQAGLNDQRVLDLNTTLSEVRDLDYVEAIGRYKLQEVVLQAAQQTYVQTSRMSLFDFL